LHFNALHESKGVQNQLASFSDVKRHTPVPAPLRRLCVATAAVLRRVCLTLITLYLFAAQMAAAQQLDLTATERAWLAAHPVIRIGVDPGFAPYSFIDAHGKPVGAASEISARVAELLGVQFDMVPGLSWPQILDGARNKTVDLIITASYRPDRESFLNFTPNYLITPTVVMTRTETPRLRSLAQLNGRSVALVTRYSSSEQAMERYPRMKVVPVANPLEGLRAVADGRAEAYIGVLGINTFMASHNGISNLKVNTGFDMNNGQAYGVRKDWPELVALLQKALAAIPQTEMEAIFSRWISVAIEDISLPVGKLDTFSRARIAALPELRVGVLQDLKPFDFLDAQGGHHGLAADILALLVKNAGFKTRTMAGDTVEQLLARLSAGELDLVLAVNGAAPGVPARLLSEPYLVSSLGVFVRKGDVFLGELRDLFDRKVAVMERGYAFDILRSYPRIEVRTYGETTELTQALLDAKVDYVVAETTSALRVVEDEAIAGVRYAGPLTEAPVRLSLAVSPRIEGLHGLVDTALASITQEEAAAIRRKWVGAPLQAGVNTRTVLRWATLLLTLMALGALAFVLWNRKLSHAVKRQTRSHEALTRSNEAMVRCGTEAELFEQICRIAVQLGGMQMAWVGLLDPATPRLRPVASFGEQADAYLQEIEVSVDASSAFGQGLTGLAVRANQPVWCKDIASDPRLAPWHALRERHGMRWRAAAVLPLCRAGLPVGVLALNAGEVNAFDAQAQALLVNMATDIGVALDKFAQQQALGAVSEQLQAVTRHAPVQLAQLDTNLCYRFVNPQYAAMFGLQPAEMVGRPAAQVLGEEAFAQASAYMQAALAGQTGEYDLELPTTAQGARTVHVTYAPERDASGQVVGFIAAILDITARKHAEDKASKSDVAYRDLFESSRDAITLTSEQGHFVGGNPAAVELFGYRDKQAFIAATVADMSPPFQPDGRRSDEKANELIATAMRDGSCQFEWVHRRVDGTEFDADTVLTLVQFKGARAVQATVRDITERKQAQAALRRSARELAALNALGKQVNASLDVAQVAQAVVDESLGAVDCDLVLLFGLEGSALNLLASAARAGIAGHRDTPVHRLGECLCGRTAASGLPAFSRNIHLDPRCTWHECKDAGFESFAGLPLLNDEHVIGILGLASASERDFEVQKQFLETLAEQASTGLQNALLHSRIERHVVELEGRVAERTTELVAAKEHAETADRMKSAFLATMSHELRTPLNSIIGFTGVMLQQLPGPLNAEQEKQLGMVRGASRHLLTLINDVLDISKIEAGEMRLNTDNFDLCQLLERVAATFAPQAQQRGLDFKLSVGERAAPLTGDARRVEQVLNNLLSNALKFTRSGSVTLSLTREDGSFVVAVTDTGAGIKPEDMGQLFKPFSQLDNGLTGLHEGTGLGLAISRHLVEAMGGKIWATSTWAEGSCFQFTLRVGKPT